MPQNRICQKDSLISAKHAEIKRSILRIFMEDYEALKMSKTKLEKKLKMINVLMNCHDVRTSVTADTMRNLKT